MDKCNDVAIVIVNYNGLEDSAECIKKIISFDLETKIVFVDNASKNNEADIIKKEFPQVICIRTDINNGYSAGCNIGMKYALEHGMEYIMILNNDTIIDEKMICILKEETKADVITVPKMFYFDEPNILWFAGGKIDKRTGKAENIGMNKPDNNVEESQLCSFATGCCFMIKADTIRKIGLMDESYFMYCEDQEYSLRAEKNNIKIMYVPKAKLWHKVSRTTGGSESAFCFYYLTRNRLKCISDYNEYFSKFAICFTIISRYIRALQFRFRGNTNWRAFLKGIKDYKRKKFGIADSIM